MLDVTINGANANDAWLSLIRRIYESGAEARPRNLRIKEIVCNTTRVDMRTPVVSVKRRKLGFRFLAAEAWWILTGRNDVASIEPYSPHIASFSNDGYRFDGAYGPRIVDQLRYIVDTLTRDPDSRQAVIEIWRPNPRDSKDVPCTLSIQWLIRNGKLHCVDTMRSSDAWLGWPYDTFNFSMLSAYVALLLRERGHKEEGCSSQSKVLSNLQLGTLWLTAGSSHLYVNPIEDGATNVPYSLVDVQGVLEVDRLRHDRSHDCNEGCPCRDPFIQYAPLNLDEFDGPSHLIKHLEACKDRKGELTFLREFQR